LWKDLNEFSPTLTPTVSNVDTIKQNIFNLFSTKPKERIFRPDYGLNVEDWLFTPAQPATLILKNTMIETINRYEPRIAVDFSKSSIVPDVSNHSFSITIVFYLVGDENSEQFQISGIFTPN